MTHVPGKWLFIVRAPVIHCIISFPPPLDWLDSCVLDGLGWAGQQWLFYFSTRSELNGVSVSVSVFVVCSLLALLLSLSLSFFSDVSVHQWLMSPPRTWLIFHLQPASQLFSELSTGPHAWTHSSTHHSVSSSYGFLASPKADVSRTSASTWFISHPVFLPPWVSSSVLFVSSSLWIGRGFGSDRSVQMLALPPFCHFSLCMRINAIIQYMFHPLLPFPGAQK